MRALFTGGSALSIFGLILLGSGSGTVAQKPAAPAKKMAVAHRGASAYAPEHTKAAYELAIMAAVELRGRGVSTDIVEAAALAALEIVNRIERSKPDTAALAAANHA